MQIGGIEHGSDKGARSPSPETKEEETEQQGVDPQETSACNKHPKDLEKGGYRKKSKAIKTLLNPITLTECDLHDIGDTFRDVIAEAL